MDIAILHDPLQWSEGMMLSPQHFQQNDIYWHQQLAHNSACLRAEHWGVVDLALDLKALHGGKLKVERLRALLPDGLAACFPDNRRETTLLCDLTRTELDWGSDRKLKVYFAVPVRVEGAASAQGAIRRYASLPAGIEKDENTGDSPVEVGRMRPIMSLLAEQEVTEKYVAFPLVEVQKTANDRYMLTGYHPPMLRSGASACFGKSSLQSRLEDLLLQVRNKAKDLVGDRRADDDEAVTLSNPETRRQVEAARRLTAALPPLEILVASRTVHPLDLYVALARLVGQVAGIGADPLPPLLPGYGHEDCIDGFEQAIVFVEERLKRLRIDFESLPFERVSGTAFTRRLPDDMLADTLVIELKPTNGQSAENLQSWLAQARIASDDLMPTLAQRRMPGASFRAVDPSRVKSLQVRPDALLFEVANQPITLDNKLMSVIRRGGTLMIQGPTELAAPAAVVLHRARVKRAAKSKANGGDTPPVPQQNRGASEHA